MTFPAGPNEFRLVNRPALPFTLAAGASQTVTMAYAPIDVGGTMDGASFSGADGLGQALAVSPDATLCVASRALEYATGRPSEDAARIEALENRFASDGYRIRALFRQVATMPAAYAVIQPPLGSDASVAARR